MPSRYLQFIDSNVVAVCLLLPVAVGICLTYLLLDPLRVKRQLDVQVTHSFRMLTAADARSIPCQCCYRCIEARGAPSKKKSCGPSRGSHPSRTPRDYPHLYQEILVPSQQGKRWQYTHDGGFNAVKYLVDPVTSIDDALSAFQKTAQAEQNRRGCLETSECATHTCTQPLRHDTHPGETRVKTGSLVGGARARHALPKHHHSPSSSAVSSDGITEGRASYSAVGPSTSAPSSKKVRFHVPTEALVRTRKPEG